jgi:ABC-2 type transport system permease protein
VVDVGRSVSLPQQIWLVAKLRWRLLRNGLRRKNNRLDLIGLLAVSILAGVVVLGFSIAFFAGAYNFAASGKLAWFALLFWAIFLWWQLFPLFLAGFGASFEFRTLLRFPLRRSAFFLVGLAYGLADLGAVASLCWLGAMAAGVAAAKLALLPAMLLISALFVAVNVTLERLIGSWLERLLANRRAREIFFALFILAVVSLQLIGPLLNRYGDSAAPWVLRLMPYISLLPASLAGRALESVWIGDLGSAFADMAGIFTYAVILGTLLWLRFAEQWRGEELSATTPAGRPANRASRVPEGSDALEMLSPQVAAIVRKEFRYLVRNGFAALLLFLPPLLVFGLISQARLARTLGNGMSAETIFPGLMAYLVLILMAPAYNSFAYEGPGIQMYFTAPLRFREIFLGKNFVQVALLATELLLCIVAFAYRVGLPSTPVFVATLTAIVFTVAGQLSIANWSSLSFPRKLVFGQIHGQRQSGMAVLVAFGAQILLFSIASVILLAGKWTGDRWLPAQAFALLSVAAAAGYLASLNALTGFAEKKKERLLEALCR